MILLLRETKLDEHIVLDECKTQWRLGEAKAVSSWGAFGGICTIWNNKVLRLESCTKS
jgi:hypothetical protein